MTRACIAAQGMLVKWTGMLGEAGLRGRHITFEPAGESQARGSAAVRARAHTVPDAASLLPRQEDVVVRYGEARDFEGPVMEFLMRQPEVASVLVRGESMSPAQFWAAHPELRQDEDDEL